MNDICHNVEIYLYCLFCNAKSSTDCDAISFMKQLIFILSLEQEQVQHYG
ncbi:hypothetical protein CZ809_01435 [Photobacterium piscicola]|uniref:Uncharacterized protein n=1 Tax=Photobacterium piscicola TaxID=1378299 RepID=A0A1T5HYR2_9GAMM|nr:hypothetical protein [Photobacterium piscicola]SKC31923.1 hypothetical protein CZ809_01435 [Photobacterium piscicola]